MVKNTRKEVVQAQGGSGTSSRRKWYKRKEGVIIKQRGERSVNARREEIIKTQEDKWYKHNEGSGTNTGRVMV